MDKYLPSTSIVQLNTDREKVEFIYKTYHTYYDGDVQGTCLVVERDIKRFIGGELVAGYIEYPSGRRSHWWVEKNGEIFDPMTDDKFYPDEYFRRESHRDMGLFIKLLPQYESYALIWI